MFALAKALAVEFGPFGIAANTIAPGIIETTRDAVHYPDFAEAYEKRRQTMPVRRLGRVEDVADACLYLCSEAGGFFTGQVMHVNGGEFIAESGFAPESLMTFAHLAVSRRMNAAN